MELPVPKPNASEDLGEHRPVREAALLFGAMFVSGIIMVIAGVMLFGDEPRLRKSYRSRDAAPTRAGVEPGRTNVTARPEER